MNATPVPPSGKKILPVVFGYDIAAYSFARIFHEAAGVRSLVVADAMRGPIDHSSIFDVRLVGKGSLDDEAAFLGILDGLAHEFSRPSWPRWTPSPGSMRTNGSSFWSTPTRPSASSPGIVIL